jgi:prepilin-type N-terminal cleavage/methylation domain-containing protein
MKRHKNNLSKNKGFTLVELIVVLVILAILSAILIPTLLGYIEQAKSKKVFLNAQACLDAARGAFIELYGKNGDVPEATPVVSGARKQSGGPTYDGDQKGNKDQDITNTEFAQNILKMAGMTGAQQPYLFMVAVGSNAKYRSDANYTRSTAQQKYTIYYGVYIEKKGQKPWYYYNG